MQQVGPNEAACLTRVFIWTFSMEVRQRLQMQRGGSLNPISSDYNSATYRFTQGFKTIFCLWINFVINSKSNGPSRSKSFGRWFQSNCLLARTNQCFFACIYLLFAKFLMNTFNMMFIRKNRLLFLCIPFCHFLHDNFKTL